MEFEEFYQYKKQSKIDEADKDAYSSEAPQKLTQEDLNDLVKLLDLPKGKSEILASRLKEYKFLKKGVKITYYRNRGQEFCKYFSKEKSVVYCNDVDGLLRQLKIKHKAADWRLFIDSSTKSLKAVLLHNGNELASIPVGYSTTMDESYNNMVFLLEKISYETHQWQICTDLKVVTILLGQQSGFTKFPCFLCLWDSRDREQHYVKKDWPIRDNFDVGSRNVIQKNLVDPSKILLPPLHIKLGLMKQFIKALKNRESEAFEYLKTKLPKLSEAKIKEGVFDGPQIRQLMKDPKFMQKMSSDERKAWKSLIDISQKYLGNFKAPNHEEIASGLVANFKKIGCLMSLKVHLLDAHRDHFPKNIGHYSEEQGERFHQDIKVLEKRYSGYEDENFLADYCWKLTRETMKKHKRQEQRRSLFQRARPKRPKKFQDSVIKQ